MVTIKGKKYTNLCTPLKMPDKVIAEPVPNPDNEHVYFDAADIFSDINQKKIKNVSEKNQNEISPVSSAYQKRIKKIAVEVEKIADEKEVKSEKTVKKVSATSLNALPKARNKIAQNPLVVMQENWELVRWLDLVFGLEKLEKMKSFPRRLASKANTHFQLEKPRSTTFYKGIVRYYSNYKHSIPIPIWWLRLELALEKTIFKLLQD